MSKVIRFVWSAVAVLCLFLTGMVFADKCQLSENIIRLRVVASTDSEEDQQHKMEVRDAINAFLKDKMKDVSSAGEAREYLASNLPLLQEVATATLCAKDCADSVKVYMIREGADTRNYDTFRLPAGVYDTLRIDIGEAKGKNWWCVVFPDLCMPTTSKGFRSTAVSAGFDTGLTESLTQSKDFEIRFFLLDCVGKLEKMLYRQ